jgi:hypothetical protein
VPGQPLHQRRDLVRRQHGHWVLNPRAKRYRIACKQLPAWAVPHADCHGTGLRACGCRPLSPVELARSRGDQRAAAS